MQVFGLQGSIYRDALRRFDQARRDGLTAEQAAKAVGRGRATLNRWSHRLEPKSRRPLRVRPRTWTSPLIRAVERLRDDFPMWAHVGQGQARSAAQGSGVRGLRLHRGPDPEELMERGRVQPVARLRKSPAVRRGCRRRHAVRLPRGLKPDRPGARWCGSTPSSSRSHQAGRSSTSPPEPVLGPAKPDPWDPVAKWTVAKAVRGATARAAGLFLDKVPAETPFPVRAIQVDGGSEFKAEFEDACQTKGLILYEPPPKRPQLNGAVERCNGAWRYEFHAVYDLPSTVEQLNPILDSFQHLYNHHRPHGALDGLTPARHLAKLQAAETPPSHMC